MVLKTIIKNYYYTEIDDYNIIHRFQGQKSQGSKISGVKNLKKKNLRFLTPDEIKSYDLHTTSIKNDFYIIEYAQMYRHLYIPFGTFTQAETYFIKLEEVQRAVVRKVY